MTWAPQTEELVRRDPNDEGPGQFGCHYYLSDQLAAIVCTDSSLYPEKERVFAQLDKHLQLFVLDEAHSVERVRAEALAQLLILSEQLFHDSWKEWLAVQDDQTAMSPSEKRDWFCYLYREFKAWKADQ